MCAGCMLELDLTAHLTCVSRMCMCCVRVLPRCSVVRSLSRPVLCSSLPSSCISAHRPFHSSAYLRATTSSNPATPSTPSFLDKKEVTERVLATVKKFDKVDATKVNETAHFGKELGKQHTAQEQHTTAQHNTTQQRRTPDNHARRTTQHATRTVHDAPLSSTRTAKYHTTNHACIKRQRDMTERNGNTQHSHATQVRSCNAQTTHIPPRHISLHTTARTPQHPAHQTHLGRSMCIQQCQ